MFTLRAESLAILGREEEAKDHVPEIARIRVQRVQPVLKSYRVRIAPQVSKVLHRHKRPVEEPVSNRLALNDVAQHFTARHLPAVQCPNQRRLVREHHLRIELQLTHIRKVGSTTIMS